MTLPTVKAMSRLDFVRGPGGDMLLMELELIEPSLYLRMDAASPARFARALDAAGQEKLAIPAYIFVPTITRTRILLEEPELASRALGAGVHATNMCGVSYSGMKGFSERVRAVTNSAKNRNYSSIRYFPDQKLIDIMLTGKV